MYVEPTRDRHDGLMLVEFGTAARAGAVSSLRGESRIKSFESLAIIAGRQLCNGQNVGVSRRSSHRSMRRTSLTAEDG
jgi:hypothetical protein